MKRAGFKPISYLTNSPIFKFLCYTPIKVSKALRLFGPRGKSGIQTKVLEAGPGSMSYPKMDNSVKTAISQLKDIAKKHESENNDVFSLVADIEKSISRIETKANRLAKVASKKSKKQDSTVPIPQAPITNTIAAF